MRAVILIGSIRLVPGTVLAEAVRYDCFFDSTCNPQDGCSAARFELEFLLDRATGAAVLVGNAGMSEVIPVPGGSGLTFLEPLPTGAMQSTTVTPSGSAVHSRHTVLGADVLASQYYGACSIGAAR